MCDEHGIEHRLTQVNHSAGRRPWTSSRAERMSRTVKDAIANDATVKDATVKRHHDDSHDQIRTHLALLVDAYNHARRLKTPRGAHPDEFVRYTWTTTPNRFRLTPPHHTPGPYS